MANAEHALNTRKTPPLRALAARVLLALATLTGGAGCDTDVPTMTRAVGEFVSGPKTTDERVAERIGSAHRAIDSAMDELKVDRNWYAETAQWAGADSAGEKDCADASEYLAEADRLIRSASDLLPHPATNQSLQVVNAKAGKASQIFKEMCSDVEKPE